MRLLNQTYRHIREEEDDRDLGFQTADCASYLYQAVAVQMDQT